MPGSEIISLQIGHSASHVGAHFWNLQEAAFRYDSPADDADGGGCEANHDVLFREGVNFRGQVTYTPRLLLVDLKGSLGSLKASGGLYDDTPSAEAAATTAAAAWDNGSISRHAAEPATRNRFLAEAFGGEESTAKLSGDAASEQPLERTVRVWSDYLGVHLHPRSAVLTPNYWHGSRQQLFGQFDLGRRMWQQPEFADELETRVRQFAEECDLLQGFHALCDPHDGFGGLAAGLLGHIREEFPKKVVLALPCFPPAGDEMSSQQAAIYQLNSLLSVVQLDALSDLAAPLSTSSCPWRRRAPAVRDYGPLRLTAGLQYHSAAVLAAWLDSASLAWRLRAGPRLWDVQQLLCQDQRRLCSPSLRLPLPLAPRASLYASLRRDAALHAAGPFADATVGCPGDFVSALSVSRGVPAARAVDAVAEPEVARQLRGCGVADVFQRAFEESHPGALARHLAFEAPVELKEPFPAVFDAAVRPPLGEWDAATAASTASAGTWLPPSVAAWALLENSSAPVDGLQQLMDCGELLLKSGQLGNAGGSVEADELRESVHSLSVMRDRYGIGL